MENMLFCQSCGMPLTDDSLFGKNADGSKNEEYCIYCYPNGEFSNPNETMEEMIDTCIPFMLEDEKWKNDEAGARKLMEEFLPTLKRWKK